MEFVLPTAFITATVGQIMSRLLDIWKKDKKEMENFIFEVHHLDRNVYEIEKLRDTILLDRHDISKWYMDLKELMYEAIDLLDAYAITVESDSDDRTMDLAGNVLFTSTFHEIDTGSSLPTVHEIKQINEKIKILFEEGRNSRHNDSIQSILDKCRKEDRLTNALPDIDHPIHGMDNIKKDIMRKLMRGDEEGESSDGRPRVVGIVGLGGMGKTTLARFAYEEAEKMGSFELSGWVWVSSEFNKESLFKCILDRFDNQSPSLNTAEHLAKVVRGKKFLLVLDDAWSTSEQDWKDFLVPLKLGKTGSRLIFTTRDRKVLEVIKWSNGDRMEPEIELTGLDDEILWKIVKEYVCNKSIPNVPKNLEEIGKMMVKKMGGSPLAAKAIGGVLRQDPKSERHWREVEESNLWESLQKDKNNELTAALVLSFLNLQMGVKSCFTYCSLLTKEENILPEELYYQWWAHDYLGETNKSIFCDGKKDDPSIEELGARVTNYLKGMSLLEEGDYDHYIRMHDLVHATSQASGRDDHLLVQSFDGKILDDLCEDRLRHLRLNSAKELSPDSFKKIGNCKKLRTLIFHSQHRNDILKLETASLTKCFQQLKQLRLLTLSGFRMAMLPEKIGELKHLKYLNLSHTVVEIFSSALAKLNHLRVLILSHSDNSWFSSTKNLEFLGQLSKLQYLDLSDNEYLERLPEAIKLLTNLQVLRLSGCHKLLGLQNEIGNLRRLERLDLFGCTMITNLPNELGTLFCLRELNLYKCEHLEKLPCELVNLKNLRRLYANDKLISRITEIGRLTSLERLYIFRVRPETDQKRILHALKSELETSNEILDEGHSIEELKTLNMLEGALRITHLENVNQNKAELAEIGQKLSLKRLKLEWSRKPKSWIEEEVIQHDQGVLEGLKPYNSLLVLEIEGYRGRQPPSWLLGYHLCFLKQLSLQSCPIMHVAVNERDIFPFLELIELFDLPKLHEWSVEHVSESAKKAPETKLLASPLFGKVRKLDLSEGHKALCLFPRLTKLHVSGCGVLGHLPDMPLSLKNVNLVSAGLKKLPRLLCQSSEVRGSASVSQVIINSCPLLVSLNTGFLEFPLPYLRELSIRYCKNLKHPPTNGFKDLESLESLEIMECPMLWKLSTISGIAALPPCLRGLVIVDCESIEESSLRTSLHHQAVTCLQKLTLKNFCDCISNSFVTDVVAPLLETVRTCDICYHELHMTISEDGTNASFIWDYKKYSINNKATEERKGSPSRADLLICILDSLRPSRIKRLLISESRDLILCNSGQLGQSFYKQINPATRLSLYQGGPLYYHQRGHGSSCYCRRETSSNIFKPDEEIGSFFIDGCSELGNLTQGIVSSPLPCIQRLMIKNCIKLVFPPVTGFTTLTALKSLTLYNCPNLTSLTMESGSALPHSLEELVIIECISLDIYSIDISLQTTLNSLRRLELYNFCYHVSNIFLKKVMSHFLENLAYCYICSLVQGRQFYWSKSEGNARIICDCIIEAENGMLTVKAIENQNITIHDCTFKDLLEEMLRRIPPKKIQQLRVAGIHEVTIIDGDLEQLFLKLTSLSLLQIVYCKNLSSLPADMSSLSSLERLEIISCDNFCPPDEDWGHVEEGKAFFALNSVKSLKLLNCHKLLSLPYSYFLEELEVRHCNALEDLSSLDCLMPQLQKLLISECENLKLPPKRMGQIGECKQDELLGSESASCELAQAGASSSSIKGE